MLIVSEGYLAVYKKRGDGVVPVFGVIEVGEGFIVRLKIGPDGAADTGLERFAEYEIELGEFMVNGVWSHVGLQPEHPWGPAAVRSVVADEALARARAGLVTTN